MRRKKSNWITKNPKTRKNRDLIFKRKIMVLYIMGSVEQFAFVNTVPDYSLDHISFRAHFSLITSFSSIPAPIQVKIRTPAIVETFKLY